MDYTKDLLKDYKKSKFALIVSVILYSIAIGWIPLRMMDKGTVSGIDWIYASIFFVNGLSQTMAGLGYSVEKLIGKAYIIINEQKINIKTGIFEKEQKVQWNEISSIDYKANNFLITKKDKSTIKLTLTKIEYSVIQEIKDSISKISFDKNILVDIN